MHPLLALWIFSMTMTRAIFGAPADGPMAAFAPQRARPTTATVIGAGRYLQSDILREPLPDMLLDRLADLHWLENEPGLAV